MHCNCLLCVVGYYIGILGPERLSSRLFTEHLFISLGTQVFCAGNTLRDTLVWGKRYVVQGMGYKVCGTRYGVQGMWYKVCGTRYGYKVCGTRCMVQGMWYKVWGTRYVPHNDVSV
jgi:hypothetical protein